MSVQYVFYSVYFITKGALKQQRVAVKLTKLSLISDLSTYLHPHTDCGRIEVILLQLQEKF